MTGSPGVHPWNYEPMYGSRVVPLFEAVGRELELLKEVDGLNWLLSPPLVFTILGHA